ncbi:unknown [Clostridium sp. CAG:58]|nr:unknown [Clostridium sp. CAG:58]
MKDKYLAVKISFPGSDLAGASIYLEDWQAERLKARVEANNRCLRSRGFPADYTIAHAIHFALEMYFRSLERKESPEAATSRGSR